MALNTFGWTPSEVTTDSAGNVISGVTLTVFTDVTKATQVTTLFDKDGVTALASGVVVSDNKGRFGFKASDAYSMLYVYDGSTADPWPIAAHEALDQGMASHAQAVADAQAAADSAAASASDAQSAANLVGAPADTAIAAAVNGPTSATRGALNATYAAPTAIADKAFGNDATDAKAHFQSKADALAAAGGGELRIPRGTYRMSGPLLVPSHVTVRGEGASTILKATFSGAGLIYNKNNASGGDTNITVTDLVVDGNGTANQGVCFAGVSRGTIHNVRVKRCTGYGIWLWAAGEGSTTTTQGIPTEQVTVSACHITDVIDTGIETDAARLCTIIGNTIEGTAGQGLYSWNGATDCTFTGNVVVGVGANTLTAFRVGGITVGATYPQQTARTLFSGNVARNVQKGLVVTAPAGNAPTDTQFVNNSCHTTIASSTGVELNYATRVMVSGNHFEGFAGRPLRVSDTGSGGTAGSVIDLIFTGNRVLGGGQSSVYGLVAGELSNNYVTGTSTHCIQFYGCTGMAISGNVFTDSGTANTSAMVFNDLAGVPSSGNVITGNRTVDTRATKYLQQAVLLAGTADYNICTGNSAKGAKASSQAVQNATTGPTVNNVIANNMNA